MKDDDEDIDYSTRRNKQFGGNDDDEIDEVDDLDGEEDEEDTEDD